MNATLKIVLVDDHPIFLTGLREVIRPDTDFEIIAEARDGEAGLKVIQDKAPDIAIIDLDLPKISGLNLARKLRELGISCHILILTMSKSELTFWEAMKLGVNGYVLKDNAADDLLAGLHAIAEGEQYISPALSSFLIRQANPQNPANLTSAGLSNLTPKERHILKLIAQHKTTPEIARSLFISPLTVQTHRRNLCTKLNLSGSHCLLSFALSHQKEL